MARKCSEGGKDPSPVVDPRWLDALVCLVMLLRPSAGAKVEDVVSSTDGYSDAALQRAESAASLRSLADHRKERPEIAINALVKLNALPLPPQTVRVSRATQGEQWPDTTAQREQRTLEATIPFGIGETFPTDGNRQHWQRWGQVNQFHGQVRSVSPSGRNFKIHLNYFNKIK